MNYKNIIRILQLTSCLFGIFPLLSQAACTFLIGSATDGQVVNFGNIVIQRDAPIGSIVATFQGNGPPNTNFINCTRVSSAEQIHTRWAAEGTSTITYNGEQLFNVGIPGLAMRVQTPGLGGSSGQYGNGPFPRDIKNNIGCTFQMPDLTWSRYCLGSWGLPTFTLIKIAATTGSGVMKIPGVFRNSLVNLTNVYTYSFGASTVSTVACSVTNTAINVPMGDVPRRSFTGIGSASQPVAFNVPLDCDAATRVNITIDAAADSSAKPGVIAIDSPTTGGAASGVGVELTRSGTPVAFGTRIPTGTATTAGIYNIPFSARYYQTQPRVTAGKANATATFTMTYN